MKARVKATKEIVEVYTSHNADFVDLNGKYYWEHELFFGSLDVPSYDDPDYWTKLEHQYAGMAMQGIIARHNVDFDMVVEWSVDLAHALIHKLKEKEERQ